MGLAVKTDGAAVAAAASRSRSFRPRRRRKESLSAGLDADCDGDGEGVHRRLHRRLGFHSRLYLDQSHQPAGGAQKAKLGEIWERFPKFILGFVATFLSPWRSRSERRQARPANSPRRSAKPMCCGDLLRADVLLDRGDVELPPALAGRIRQAGGGLSGVAVRFRRLGRVCHFVAFFAGVKPPLAS